MDNRTADMSIIKERSRDDAERILRGESPRWGRYLRDTKLYWRAVDAGIRAVDPTTGLRGYSDEEAAALLAQVQAKEATANRLEQAAKDEAAAMQPRPIVEQNPLAQYPTGPTGELLSTPAKPGRPPKYGTEADRAEARRVAKAAYQWKQRQRDKGK